MNGVTQYGGVAGFYFHHLLSQIIRIGNLNNFDGKILDFGCGVGQLKRRLGGDKVIGYDVIQSLSDVHDWRSTNFDVFVANQVLYSFSEKDLNSLLEELKSKNPDLRMIVGISRQGMLNNIGKYLLGRPNAHSHTKIRPEQEIEILQRHGTILQRKNVFWLADVYLLKFN